jgi:AraC-like DNA-binding protein
MVILGVCDAFTGRSAWFRLHELVACPQDQIDNRATLKGFGSRVSGNVDCINGGSRMNDQHGVSSGGSSRRFVDPDQFQASIRGGDNMYSLLGRGVFHAELTDIKAGRLLLQRGRETLPRLASTSMPPNRVGILGWFGESQLPVVRGAQMRQGEFMYLGLGMQSHHRTFGRNDFAALTLDASDLARAAMDLTGRELAVTSGKVLRPPDHLGTWLLSVIDAATRAGQTTPGIFTSRPAADALEQALLRPMITCLLDGEARNEGVPRGHRAAIARRFAAAVEASLDHPLLILDLCRMVGITARTLNTLCQEQFGVSAQRFLALRRLHLTRRALLRSDRLSTTVTEVATGYGIWELGRFAVAYKSLFGESPSATLRRIPELSRTQDLLPATT